MDTKSLSLDTIDINLFKPKEVIDKVRYLIINEKKFILLKTQKQAKQILLSGEAYEVVVAMESRYEDGSFHLTYPTEIYGMQIIVDGSMKGIYVRALMDTMDEWLHGKSIRGDNNANTTS